MHTTTPIANVPPACAELWQPYMVTMVPPPDILQQEHVPAAPRVVNMTNGAVSDAEAQHWADANNSGAGWYKWAEQYDQPFLLSRLAGPENIPSAEIDALTKGASIIQPDCNLYPMQYVLHAVGDDGRAYFARKGLPTDDTYVFAASYRGGTCAETARYPDGQTTSLPALSSSVPVFEPGQLRHDTLLGDNWYTDGGGSCADPIGPPPEWCGR